MILGGKRTCMMDVWLVLRQDNLWVVNAVVGDGRGPTSRRDHFERQRYDFMLERPRAWGSAWTDPRTGTILPHRSLKRIF